jgi:phosphatidate cytidylyltransferase
MGFGLLLLIRRDHSAWWIVGIIATVKMCDTGAFFVGCNIGKRKMIPWVSPAKSWEGLIGGLVTASLTAIGLAALNNAYLPDEPTISLGFAGVLFGALGQLGDLLISVFKRDSGIKDASSVLPGLGGILDVLDSLLLVSVAAYWLLP